MIGRYPFGGATFGRAPTLVSSVLVYVTRLFTFRRGGRTKLAAKAKVAS